MKEIQMNKNPQLVAEFCADDAELMDALHQLQRAARKAAKTFDESFKSSGNTMKFERGVRKSSREMRALNQETSTFGRTLKNQVVPYLSMMVSYMGARELAHFADTWTRANNLIKQVSGSQKELIQQQKILYDIAQNTRSSYEGTASLFAKTKRAGDRLGVNLDTKDYAKFTELVGKGLKTGGADAAAQNAAILQLSQAIDANKLQGDELKTLRETAGTLLDQIAKGMNMSMDEFFQAAENGELSLEKLVKATLASTDEIEKAFEKTGSTLGEAGTKMGNTLTKLIGEVNDAGGFTDSLVEGINKVIAAIDKLDASDIEHIAATFKILAGSAVALGTGRVASSIAAKATALGKLTETAKQAAIAEKKLAQESAKTALQAKKAAQEDVKLAQARVTGAKAALAEAKDTKTATVAIEQHKAAITNLKQTKQFATQASTQFANAQKRAAAASQQVALKARIATAATKSFNSALAFFGGPLGLAITAFTALTAATMKHANITVSAEDVLLKYEDRIKSLRGEVEGLTDSMDKASKLDLGVLASENMKKLEQQALKVGFQENYKNLPRDVKNALAEFDINLQNLETKSIEDVEEAFTKVAVAVDGSGLALEQIIKQLVGFHMLGDDIQKISDAMTPLQKKARATQKEIEALRKELAGLNASRGGASSNRAREIAQELMVLEKERALLEERQRQQDLGNQLIKAYTWNGKTGTGQESQPQNSAKIEFEQRYKDAILQTAEAKQIAAEAQRILNDAKKAGVSLSEAEVQKLAEEAVALKNIVSAKENLESLADANFPLRGLIDEFGELSKVIDGTDESMQMLADAADTLGDGAEDALAAWWTGLESTDTALINTTLNADNLQGVMGTFDSSVFQAAMTGVGKAAAGARAQIIALLKVAQGHISSALNSATSIAEATALSQQLDQINGLIDGAENVTAEQAKSAGGKGKKKGGGGGSKKDKDPISELERYRQKVEELDKQLAKGTITQMQYNEKIWELAKGMEGHLGEVMHALDQVGESFADNFADVIVEGFGNAEDAIRNFGESLKDIGKQLIKMSLMNVFRSGMGGLFGGGGFGSLFKFSDGGQVKGFATGGFVSGGGTSRSDSIPAMLSNGEYVINAKATKQYAPLLEAINYGQMDKIVRRARGGFVGVNNNIQAIKTAAAEGKINQNNNVNNNMSLNPTINITMEGSSGDAKQDGKLAQDIAGKVNVMMERKFYELLNKESRPGGAFSKSRR